VAKASAFLDNGVTNNWSNDKYDWSKEIVVVTGGSDGIGKIVVQLFAEMGVKVAVMDVQPLTYEGTHQTSPSQHTPNCLV
jgi:NADPH:quinone reductase-like Zn-dependent oxidoreductase